MKRSYLVPLLALVYFSIGWTTSTQEEIGKIYLFGSTLIRTDGSTGMSFYDISSPASPRKISTFSLTGNSDVAVKGRYLYADQESNLVVIDIGDLSTPRPVDTIGAVFNSFNVRIPGEGVPMDRTVGGASGCGSCSASDQIAAPTTREDAGGSGEGGSLARFAIVGNRLYCVDMTTIRVFDISDPARPRYKNSVEVEWGIETIFHDGEYLFIGGQSGMYVYREAGDTPVYVSRFTHRRNCDPVVVEGDRAYVTLRGGSACGGFDNQLDILDISDIRKPKLLQSVPMEGPYGLGVRNDTVLICNGAAGLKVLDTRTATNPVSVARLEGMVAHDVILSDDLLIVATEGGYELFDARDLARLKRFGQLVLP